MASARPSQKITQKTLLTPEDKESKSFLNPVAMIDVDSIHHLTQLPGGNFAIVEDNNLYIWDYLHAKEIMRATIELKNPYIYGLNDGRILYCNAKDSFSSQEPSKSYAEITAPSARLKSYVFDPNDNTSTSVSHHLRIKRFHSPVLFSSDMLAAIDHDGKLGIFKLDNLLSAHPLITVEGSYRSIASTRENCLQVASSSGLDTYQYVDNKLELIGRLKFSCMGLASTGNGKLVCRDVTGWTQSKQVIMAMTFDEKLKEYTQINTQKANNLNYLADNLWLLDDDTILSFTENTADRKSLTVWEGETLATCQLTFDYPIWNILPIAHSNKIAISFDKKPGLYLFQYDSLKKVLANEKGTPSLKNLTFHYALEKMTDTINTKEFSVIDGKGTDITAQLALHSIFSKVSSTVSKEDLEEWVDVAKKPP